MKGPLWALLFSGWIALQSLPQEVGAFWVSQSIDDFRTTVIQTVYPSSSYEQLVKLFEQKLWVIDGLTSNQKREFQDFMKNPQTQKQISRILKENEGWTPQNIICSLVVGLLIVWAYISTIKKVKHEYMPIDPKSFSLYTLSSFWMVVLNGNLPWSLVYFELFVLAGYTLFLHHQNKKHGKTSDNFNVWEFIHENPLPIIIHDSQNRPTVWNKQIEQETGYTFQEVLDYYEKHGEAFSIFYTGDILSRVLECQEIVQTTGKWFKDLAFTLKTKSWEEKTFLWTIIPNGDGGTVRTAVHITDMLDIQKELENTKELINKDPLTHAYTRRALETDLHSLFENYERLSDSKEVILVLLDIDYFKYVNDIYGHQFGDHVLKTLTSFVQAWIRQEDKMYRIGGDEFMILIHSGDLPTITAKLNKLRQDFYNLEFQNISPVTHIGTSWWIAPLSICQETVHSEQYKIIEKIKEQVDYYMYSVKYFSLIREELLARGVNEAFLNEKNAIASPFIDEVWVFQWVCIHSDRGEVFITKEEMSLIVQRKKDNIDNNRMPTQKGLSPEDLILEL